MAPTSQVLEMLVSDDKVKVPDPLQEPTKPGLPS